MGSAMIDPALLAGLSPEERHALAAEVRAELARNNLADYSPYPKQRKFHRLGATKRERLLRAGNQQGKSLCLGAEMAMHLTGRYPSWWQGRRWTRPILAWAAGETAEATRDNPQRILLGFPGEEGTGMIPADCLALDTHDMYGLSSGAAGLYDYVRVKHVSGGWSMLRYKNYAQGRKKWQGPPVDFVWFDEEPDEDIYDEGLARTIATGGVAAMSFTPLQGMSSVVRRFLMEKSEERAEVCMTIYDAEHIDPDERDAIIRSFPAHERKARALGTPTLGSGRIYPVDEAAITVEPFKIPDLWPRLGGMDFGWDHPFAAVSVAHDLDTDCIYVHAGYRKSRAVPAIHASALRPWGEMLPWAWPQDGFQTEKGTGIQLAEQYRDQGLQMLHEHAQFLDTGDDTRISRTSVEAGLSEILTRMEDGRFKVFSSLHDWLEEFRLYHRKDGKIVKLGDDLMDATRYAVMMIRHAQRLTKRQSSVLDRPPPDWRA